MRMKLLCALVVFATDRCIGLLSPVLTAQRLVGIRVLLTLKGVLVSAPVIVSDPVVLLLRLKVMVSVVLLENMRTWSFVLTVGNISLSCYVCPLVALGLMCSNVREDRTVVLVGLIVVTVVNLDGGLVSRPGMTL